MRTFIERNLQTILNHYLALDPESKTRLKALQNKIITIELQNINCTFQLIFSDEEMTLKFSDLLPANTIIKGTPLTLLHMSLNTSDRKRFFAEDVIIEGEIELGQKVIDLLDELEIDWEEYLSHWIGDIPAHQTGRLAKSIKNFSKNLRETLLQNINEYAHEEINLFPPREEIQDFFTDVDNLRMDVDRLEARIEKLTRPLE